jgi:hypothetical protein
MHGCYPLPRPLATYSPKSIKWLTFPCSIDVDRLYNSLLGHPPLLGYRFSCKCRLLRRGTGASAARLWCQGAFHMCSFPFHRPTSCGSGRYPPKPGLHLGPPPAASGVWKGPGGVQDRRAVRDGRPIVTKIRTSELDIGTGRPPDGVPLLF